MLDDFSKNLFTSLEKLSTSILDWLGMHLPSVAVILIGGYLIKRYTPPVINRFLHRTIPVNLYPTKSDRDKRLKTIDSLVSAFVKLAIYVVGFLLIVAEVKPGYTPALFASAGIATVALGFGAQSLVKDFVTGVFVITENQYRVGDTITIADVTGEVEDVTVRTTVLRDIEGYVHFVPNGLIGVATNKTMGFTKINEEFVVPAGTDMDEFGQIVADVGEKLAKMPEFKNKIIKPPVLGNTKGYAPDGGLVVSIVGRTAAGDKWRIRSELYSLLSSTLAKKGIHATSLPTTITKIK